jgi:hypothetical protein
MVPPNSQICAPSLGSEASLEEGPGGPLGLSLKARTKGARGLDLVALKLCAAYPLESRPQTPVKMDSRLGPLSLGVARPKRIVAIANPEVGPKTSKVALEREATLVPGYRHS